MDRKRMLREQRESTDRRLEVHVSTPDDRATLQAIRRDIEARIQEAINCGDDGWGASLLEEWRGQVEVLKRLAP